MNDTTIETRRRVLFVDDDPRFLEMMERVMGGFSRGRWEVLTAENASRALGLVGERVPHLVVIDVQMPVVDGLQFLTLLNRRHPNLLKVVLTGFATEAYRAACLSNGAELFLEKPKTKGEQEALFAALDELMKFRPEEGFRGVLRKVGLTEIIQMECLGAGSSVLEVKAGRQRGRIYIHEGAILHAEAGDLAGEQAFNFLLGLPGGEFSLRPFAEPPEQTIQGSWEFLLMEAVRQKDEAGGAAESAGEEAGQGESTDLTAALAQLAAGQDPAEQAGLTEPVVGMDGEPLPRRVIEEMFLCSQQGLVLQEWQVRNGDLWVNFFEFLSQKSQRLAMGLPFERFERVEMGAAGEHLTILIDDDRGLLVRWREEGVGADPVPTGRPGKEQVDEWLDGLTPEAGVYAVAVRYPDLTVQARVMGGAVTMGALENMSRCVGDAYRVLKVHRLPAVGMRWGFGGGELHCARRADDLLLAVVTSSGVKVGSWARDFLAMSGLSSAI